VKLVVDTNILISTIIAQGDTMKLFLDHRLELFAPLATYLELHKHASVLTERSRLDQTSLIRAVVASLSRIKTVSDTEILPFQNWAFATCPDPEDAVFFATARFLNCPLWSNDKRLKEQKEVLVYSTREIIDILTKTNA
jgi:predicted nucleic acid-binding protein